VTIRSVFALLTLTIALLAATPTTAAAQIGVLVGVNSAKLHLEDESEAADNEFIERRNGFVGGVTLNMPVQQVFSVEIDALVGVKGAKFDFGGGDEGTVKLTYVDFPIMGRVNIPGGTNTGFHLLFGPSFNFKLSESFDPDDDPGEDDVFGSLETAVVVGGGVKVSRLRIDARWGMGLTNLEDESDQGSDGVKGRWFSVLFGFEL
jgi:hypothetical protein